MYSSKDIYHINPPRNLQPSDWVIELSHPEIPSGLPLAIARQQYQNIRLDRLIGFIENRFPKGCCFYDFLDENKDQDPLPGQTRVTNLFAYHEIDHWPGAQAHVKWTEFVMENLEYDARVEAQASEQGLTLPNLPIEAVPIFKAVQVTEGKKLAKKAARTGKSVKELTAYRFERVDPETQTCDPIVGHQPDEIPNPKRLRLAIGCELDQETTTSPSERIIIRPTHPTEIQSQGAFGENEKCEPVKQAEASSESVPPAVRPDFFLDVLSPYSQGRLYQRQLVAACHKPEDFRIIAAGHARWTTHTVKKLHRFMLRIIFSHEGSINKTWEFCNALARQKIHGFSERAFVLWRQVNSAVPFDEHKDFPNWLTKMYEYLLATLRFKDPIPADMPPHRARVTMIQQAFIAMIRQQMILRNWTTELGVRAAERGQVRFRAEPNCLMDLWTGQMKGRPRRTTGPATELNLSHAAQHMLAMRPTPGSMLASNGGVTQMNTQQGNSTVPTSEQ